MARRGSNKRPDYEYLRAWCRFRQYPLEMLEQQLRAARLQHASPRVVFFDLLAGRWYTVDDLAPDVYHLVINEYEQRHRVRRAQREQAEREARQDGLQ